MQVQIIRPNGQSIVVGGQGGNATTFPRSRAEMDALITQRAELQSQIQALRDNREELSDAINGMGDSPGRAELQLRLKEVDARILRLDRQLDQINDQVAASPTTVTGQVFTTTVPPRVDPVEAAVARNIVPLTAIFSTMFLLPMAFAMARLIWKRGTALGQRPALNEQAMMSRLEQLQTSMDATALEVERISENQRYITKQLNDKDRAALPR